MGPDSFICVYTYDRMRRSSLISNLDPLRFVYFRVVYILVLELSFSRVCGWCVQNIFYIRLYVKLHCLSSFPPPPPLVTRCLCWMECKLVSSPVLNLVSSSWRAVNSRDVFIKALSAPLRWRIRWLWGVEDCGAVLHYHRLHVYPTRRRRRLWSKYEVKYWLWKLNCLGFLDTDHPSVHHEWWRTCSEWPWPGQRTIFERFWLWIRGRWVDGSLTEWLTDWLVVTLELN